MPDGRGRLIKEKADPFPRPRDATRTPAARIAAELAAMSSQQGRSLISCFSKERLHMLME